MFNDAIVLWTLHNEAHEVRCEVRIRLGAVQASVIWDGAELYSITLADCVAIGNWAQNKRQHLESWGWRSFEANPERGNQSPPLRIAATEAGA